VKSAFAPTIDVAIFLARFFSIGIPAANLAFR
jgi:hypothetical protein